MPELVKLINHFGELNSPNGQIISFYYEYFNHDPYPVILTTGLMSHGRIGGLNLKYLTFPVYRDLITQWADNQLFQYNTIKNNNIIRNSFRSYKVSGIRNAKLINWKSIVTALDIIRNYSPQEINNIRQSVLQQVASRQPEIIQELLGKVVES